MRNKKHNSLEEIEFFKHLASGLDIASSLIRDVENLLLDEDIKIHPIAKAELQKIDIALQLLGDFSRSLENIAQGDSVRKLQNGEILEGLTLERSKEILFPEIIKSGKSDYFLEQKIELF